MENALNLASANGFILGLLVAEQFHSGPLASVPDKEAALFDLILGIADGTKTLGLDTVPLLQSLTDSVDAAKAHKSMQETALRLIEWYRQELLA